MAIDINDLIKCDILTNSDIVRDLTPKQLIKNPHVKKLVEALEEIYNVEPYEEYTCISMAEDALAAFKKKGEE
jgi:hypothetical protein